MIFSILLILGVIFWGLTPLALFFLLATLPTDFVLIIIIVGGMLSHWLEK